MPEKFPPPNFIPTESKIPGIEVYMPAPVEKPVVQEVTQFTCPRCGAATAYDIRQGGLACEYCGYSELTPGEKVGRTAIAYEFTTATMQRAAQGWGPDRKEFACESCGAVTSVDGGNLTHTCPFCGSNKVIQRVAAQDVLRPRYLIPFKIESPTCEESVKEWLGSSWMTASGLKDLAILDRFTGIYLPYWTFSALTSAGWKAEVGHTEIESYYVGRERRTRTKTTWHWESGQVEKRFDDWLVQGSTRVSQKLLDQINTFNLDDLLAFEPAFLAGYQAQAYDRTLENAWEMGRSQMRDQTRSACTQQASSTQIRNFNMTLDFAEESWRYILLPVYLANYKYESQLFQILVNGQNGSVSGQRPVNWTLVWLVVVAILLPGVCGGLLGLVTLPFAGIGAAIGTIALLLLIAGIAGAFYLVNKARTLDDA